MAHELSIQNGKVEMAYLAGDATLPPERVLPSYTPIELTLSDWLHAEREFWLALYNECHPQHEVH